MPNTSPTSPPGLEQRVRDRIARELLTVDGELEATRDELRDADTAYDQALTVERRAWAKADRGRDRDGQWPVAMQALDDAHNQLMAIHNRIRRLEQQVDRLGRPDELERRVATTERLEALRASKAAV